MLCDKDHHNNWIVAFNKSLPLSFLITAYNRIQHCFRHDFVDNLKEAFLLYHIFECNFLIINLILLPSHFSPVFAL